MRSSIHGTFATFLLLIPVGIIPTLAIFGIPQFAPVVASPLSDGNENEYDSSEANSGNGPAEGLYQDLDSFHSTNEDVVHVTDPMKESAAIPNRSVPRENRTRNREANERTVISNSRLPSWAKDLPSKDSRKTTTALRDAVPFEGASSRRDVLPQGESSPRVSDSFASSRNMESNSDEFQRTEQTNDHHIRPLANDVEERVALPSQRRRDAAGTRCGPLTREFWFGATHVAGSSPASERIGNSQLPPRTGSRSQSVCLYLFLFFERLSTRLVSL